MEPGVGWKVGGGGESSSYFLLDPSHDFNESDIESFVKDHIISFYFFSGPTFL